ncbi:MAG: hypothetical protein LBQ52_10710 [Helicobacteraceae bacterium]|jgi:hypothetical protein|nr:hypothetical protein [Helicobacteraceae bacterium]
MKRSIVLTLLALSVGFFGGCVDKEKGEEQFKEAETILKDKGNQKEAFKLLEKSCGNDYAKSCGILSLAYVEGDKKLNVEADKKKSIALALKANTLSADEACEKDKEGAECKRRTKFIEDFEKSCKGVESKDCELAIIFGAILY